MGCSGSRKSGGLQLHHPPGPKARRTPPDSAGRNKHRTGLLPPGNPRLAYELTNTGGSPLIVTQVLPSCGCAIAEHGTPLPSLLANPPILLRFEAGESTRTLSESATVVTNAVPASVEWVPAGARPERIQIQNHDPFPHPARAAPAGGGGTWCSSSAHARLLFLHQRPQIKKQKEARTFRENVATVTRSSRSVESTAR